MGTATVRAGLAPLWWTGGMSRAERPAAGRVDTEGAAASPEPEWARFVAVALAVAAGGPGDRPEPHNRPEPGDWPEAFARVFAGFVATARDQVRAGAPHGAAGRGLESGIDFDALLDDFGDRLGRELAQLAGRTLVTELHRAREAGELVGPNARARFVDFTRRIAQPDRLAAMLGRYPVLARLLATAGTQAAQAQAELLDRYASDRAEIVAALLDGSDPGPLTRVESGLGDAHHGGRSTAVLHFAGGARVVYKPRSLGPHLHFTELVGWLNRAIGSDLRTVAALGRDGYGWLAYVPQLPCRTRAEVDRFYYRQGVFLALLHAVDATDIHYENLVACADQPVLVDVETLYHPRLTPAVIVEDPAAGVLGASVLNLFLLPQVIAGDRGVMDLSGMGGDPGSAHAHDQVSWTDAGTDRMRLSRGPGTLTAAANRPRLGGRDADAVDHEAALTAGFTAGYRGIGERRTEFADLVARAAGEDVRVVTQPTWLYLRLLTESTHPDVLRDALDRDDVFDLLADAAAGDPVRQRLLRHELADLWRGDVPFFTGRPGSRDLYASDGEHLPDVFAVTSLAAVTAKIAAMGAPDRLRQEWLVAAALAARRARQAPVEEPSGAALAPAPHDPDRLVAAAASVADLIVSQAIDGRTAVNWLGFDLAAEAGWRVLPMGASLSDGYTGVALFLAQLAHVVGEPRYAEIAARAVGHLPRVLDALTGRPDLIGAVGCGGLDGFGGIAYASARLATLLDDPDLRRTTAVAVDLADAAVRLHPTVDTAMPHPSGPASGVSGCLAAMLAVHAETGLAAAARLAVTCAEHLIAAVADRDARGPAAGAPPGDVGGLGGPGSALVRAGAALGDARYVEAGLAALRASAGDVPSPRLGWCEGAAGTLMAYAEIPAALAGTTQNGPVGHLVDRTIRRDLSLCHGELGMIDALMSMADRDPRAAAAWRPQGARLAGALGRPDDICGTPRGVATPGLLRGLAGIGYQLLRVGLHERVPSVLALRPTPPVRRDVRTPRGEP